jgi:uncharacterized protein
MSNSHSRRRAAAARERQVRDKAPDLRSGETPPTFVADVMLGRLAKWLRIAGFDVLYSNRFSDDELVSLSAGENRILLSRDMRLLVRRAVRRFIMPDSDDVLQQVRQVLEALGFERLPALLTRCLECTQVLSAIPKEQVQDRVPPYVYQTQEHFKRCPACGRVYWAGTHRQSVLSTLEKLFPK